MRMSHMKLAVQMLHNYHLAVPMCTHSDAGQWSLKGTCVWDVKRETKEK